jgi:hypothetical protein
MRMTTPHRHAFRNQLEMERAAGIEPASLAWKAKVLPLHNARDIRYLVRFSETIWHGFGTVLMNLRLD